jgi:hypothetical protein
VLGTKSSNLHFPWSRSASPPHYSRLPHVRIGDIKVIPSDPDFPPPQDPVAIVIPSVDGDFIVKDDSDFIDSGAFDFMVPPVANLADITNQYASVPIIHNNMEYRAFQH